jgi:hypothetical protein
VSQAKGAIVDCRVFHLLLKLLTGSLFLFVLLSVVEGHDTDGIEKGEVDTSADIAAKGGSRNGMRAEYKGYNQCCHHHHIVVVDQRWFAIIPS